VTLGALRLFIALLKVEQPFGRHTGFPRSKHMKFRQLAILVGPVAIRDLIVGSGGVAYGGVAFLLGFASVSQVHLVWFASWSFWVWCHSPTRYRL
jgi:hypothetical protein